MKYILLFLLTLPYFALSFVPSGDNDYFILKEDQYRIIFDEQYLDSIDQINQKVKIQMNSMSKFKKRNLDEPINIILLSPKSQISNAFATVIPFYTIGMYPTGVISLTTLSEPNWFDGVFEHELNHVFQLSHSKYPRLWRKTFRLPSVIWFLIIKQFNPYPNIFLPRFITEGDAVLKESLDRNGGRLYSGAARAFVYSQIRHYQHQIDKFTEEKLLTMKFYNPHLGNEIYLHGGYIMAMLSEKYSQDTIHSFFSVNKDKPPAKEVKKIQEETIDKILSPSFGKIFSFQHSWPFLKNIVKAYFNHYLKEASKQKYSTTPVRFESSACTPFNQFKDELFFLTSDFKSTPTLNIFNKKEKKWTDQKIDLPLGKVFKIDNKYYSRSTQRVAPNTTHYSLFSKGLKSNNKFDSRYVTDIKNNKVLSIDTKNNLDTFKLYLNDKYYTNVHSEALFDKNENIYYFKQKGNRRTLYKNKTPLLSYAGYYGNLLEIDKTGDIYFTGASRYGSSVYRYKSGSISRVVSSDTVLQAQKINKKEFIICEVTPYKYEYKIVPQVTINERPIFYKYNFKKNSTSLTSKNNESIDSLKRKPASQKNKTTKNLKQENLNYQPYSALKNIRFGGGQFIGISFGLFSLLGTVFIISDYLLQNFMQLMFLSAWEHWDLGDNTFDWNKDNFNLFNVQYMNRVYNLNWTLGYSSEFTTERIRDHIGYIGLSYPLLRKGRWSSYMASMHAIQRSEYIEEFSVKIIDNTLSVDDVIKYAYDNEFFSRGIWNISYSQKFPFNYFLPNKSATLQFFVDHQYYKRNPKWDGWKGGVIGNSTWHIGQNYYVMPSASYAVSLNEEINPVEIHSYTPFISPSKLNDKQKNNSPLHSNILYSDDTTDRSFIPIDIYGGIFQRRYLAKSIGTASLGLKKTFPLPSNITIASFRSRWIVLEQFLSYKPLLLTPEQGVSATDPSRLYTDTITDLTKQLRPRDEKKLESKYTHWLEWTLGLEYLYMLQNNIPFIMGFSFGFRTPLKFWKDSDDNNAKVSTGDIMVEELAPSSTSIPIQEASFNSMSRNLHNPTLSSSLLNDTSIQLYVKIPL